MNSVWSIHRGSRLYYLCRDMWSCKPRAGVHWTNTVRPRVSESDFIVVPVLSACDTVGNSGYKFSSQPKSTNQLKFWCLLKKGKDGLRRDSILMIQKFYSLLYEERVNDGTWRLCDQSCDDDTSHSCLSESSDRSSCALINYDIFDAVTPIDVITKNEV
jgi:hypothetical protein